MPAGDISYDQGMPVRAGNNWVIRGTIEVDDTPRNFVIVDSNSRIMTASLHSADGVGSAQVDTNMNTSAVETSGTLAIFGNHQSVDTYRFDVSYI